jgi:hypothetical protein
MSLKHTFTLHKRPSSSHKGRPSLDIPTKPLKKVHEGVEDGFVYTSFLDL